MAKINIQELIKNGKVIHEIERHKWFESEKAGYDIGFEQASKDWFNNFSKGWITSNTPQSNKTRIIKTAKKTAPKKRASRSRTAV